MLSIILLSVEIAVDRIVEIFYRVGIAGIHGVGYAMLKMVFEDHLGGTVQRRAYRGKLDKHLGAVTPLFDHTLYGFQMSDRSCKSVCNGLAVGVPVRMIGMYMLMSLVLRYVGVGRVVVTMNYSVTVVMIKSVVGSVHRITSEISVKII